MLCPAYFSNTEHTAPRNGDGLPCQCSFRTTAECLVCVIYYICTKVCPCVCVHYIFTSLIMHKCTCSLFVFPGICMFVCVSMHKDMYEWAVSVSVQLLILSACLMSICFCVHSSSCMFCVTVCIVYICAPSFSAVYPGRNTGLLTNSSSILHLLHTHTTLPSYCTVHTNTYRLIVWIKDGVLVLMSACLCVMFMDIHAWSYKCFLCCSLISI